MSPPGCTGVVLKLEKHTWCFFSNEMFFNLFFLLRGVISREIKQKETIVGFFYLPSMNNYTHKPCLSHLASLFIRSWWFAEYSKSIIFKTSWASIEMNYVDPWTCTQPAGKLLVLFCDLGPFKPAYRRITVNFAQIVRDQSRKVLIDEVSLESDSSR